MNRLMPLLLAFAAVVATAGPATAHDWYSGLKSPITGGPCCSTRDCEAVPSRYANGGLELYANGLWTPAPREALETIVEVRCCRSMMALLKICSGRILTAVVAAS